MPSTLLSMIEVIDTWVERKLLESLKASTFFSSLTDECNDVYSHGKNTLFASIG